MQPGQVSWLEKGAVDLNTTIAMSATQAAGMWGTTRLGYKRPIQRGPCGNILACTATQQGGEVNRG
jgi:hypothetical protein